MMDEISADGIAFAIQLENKAVSVGNTLERIGGT
jgi:hypothetical protein